MREQTAREINREAAEWIAKVDRGLSAAEQRALDEWLVADPRRLGAYAIMRATDIQTIQAAALSFQYERTDSVDETAKSRRNVLVGGSALAASVVGTMVVQSRWLDVQRYQSRKGEVRQVVLQDGSVIMLNTASSIDVGIHPDSREIELLEGEAFFEVAPDKRRPCTVTATTTTITVLGTSFCVRHCANGLVEILVSEGQVRLERVDGLIRATMLLSSDMRATSSPHALGMPADGMLASSRLPARELARCLSWRSGQLAFEGETLAQAADEFARYSDTRIVISDPVLAREQIVGLYRTTDPIGFAQAAAVSLDAETAVSEGQIRIYR